MREKKPCNYDGALNVGLQKLFERSLKDYLSITWRLQAYKNV
jgi:hypothetical protein